MKRLIPAFILLIIVIGAYIFSLKYIENTYYKVYDMVEECENSYKESTENSLKYANKLENEWDSKENVLSLFVNHEKIDEIELAICNIKTYSYQNESPIFYEYCEMLKTLLHQLMEDISISPHSIM